MSFNLNARHFHPVRNSDGGRVNHETLFRFSQTGQNFTAVYSGANVFDGHIIGFFMNENKAKLIYHARTNENVLEAGEATAIVDVRKDGRYTLSMTWQWLNGSMTSGTSDYIEIPIDERKT